MKYMGDYVDNAIVRIFFTTNNSSGGAIAPSTAFENADVRIYKNGSAVQKTTVNGITMTSPFDMITGLHLLEIDTGNDTGDAGFWVSGNDYSVVLSPDETVDGQIIAHPLTQFSIENRSALRPTTAGNTLDVSAAGNAGATLADVAQGGTSAVLTLERVIIVSTTTNEPGVEIAGDGSAPGTRSTGGATGDGLEVIGGSTSGAGLLARSFPTSPVYSAGAGDGFAGIGSGGSAGMRLEASGGGPSMSAQQDILITTPIEADMMRINNIPQDAVDLGDFAAQGYDPITNKVQGVVLVDTNTDMRGTDSALLAASAPTNFGSLVITAGGAVDSLLQGYLNTLILESTAGRIAANFDNFYDNADAVTTKVVGNVGGEDIYHAEINLTIDTNNTRDEYTVTWLKNGIRITSGITVPTINVIKRIDGTDLIPSTAMLEIGSIGSYKHDEPTNRITGGDAVMVIANATIDSGARSFIRLRSRDS